MDDVNRDGLPHEIRKCGNAEVYVFLVPKEVIHPWMGMAYGHISEEYAWADVRDDLPPRVQRFVIEHELYHLRDKWKWWGSFGAELRANLRPALNYPLDYLAYLGYAIVHSNRTGIYLKRLVPCWFNDKP